LPGVPMDPDGCYYAADPSFIQPDRRQPVPRVNSDEGAVRTNNNVRDLGDNKHLTGAGPDPALTAVRPSPKMRSAKRNDPDYTTNLNLPRRFEGRDPKEYTRSVPDLADLLLAKERENALRHTLSAADLPVPRQVELQLELVGSIEAAGEDPLPEFAKLCRLVADCPGLGQEQAWDLASRNIARFYDACFYKECLRYCRMVIEAPWAGDEAKAWALLRVICCHRLQGETGAVRQRSRELMRQFPETEAAREHTRAAVQWLVAGLDDAEAVDLLDRMAQLHAESPAYVVKCRVEAADICMRRGEREKVAGYAGMLAEMADETSGLENPVRDVAGKEADRLRQWLSGRARQKTDAPVPGADEKN